MKIIFMGTPDYADAILKKLLNESDIEVVAAFTQPDKPVGRKKILTPPPVKTTAQDAGIAVHQPTRLREQSAIESLQQYKCDFIVVAAYGQILPREILEHAPCINLHASILPAYRGASPIQQTLLNGDSETGITAMLMDEGLDTGDILKIEKIAVSKDEMLESLFHRLTKVAAELTPYVLRNFDTLKPQPQDDTLATYCKKISKADGLIHFDNAEKIYNKYRAFTPWPGIFLKSGLKLKKVKLLSCSEKYNPGEILNILKESIEVGCQKGSLEISTLQPASKKEMNAVAYINGKRLQIADTLV